MNRNLTDNRISSATLRALRLASVLFLILVFFFTLSPSSRAAESVDNSRLCSLTLDYHSGGTVLPGVAFRIYRVADVSESMAFTLSGDFASYGVNLNNLNASGWRAAANSLASHIAPDAIFALRTQSTDSSGKVSFTSLQTGLYLVTSDSIVLGNTTYYTSPFLISLPNSYDGNTLIYDLTAVPKVAYNEPHHEDNSFDEVSVIKVWNDDGNESRRPKNINVTLMRDGKTFSTYELNASNGWAHTWTDLETGHVWSVVENNVPDGYTVTYSSEGTKLYITNTYNDKKYVNISVIKVWNDEGNAEKRPASINVSLLKDGSVYETFTLDESNGWKHTWSGLSSANVWTIQEIKVPDGYVPSYFTENGQTTITNTYKKNVDISVIKVWDDAGNENKRPVNISVSLLKDGNVYDTYTLSADNNWKHTWSSLSGSANWTVIENNIPAGYTATYTSNGSQRVITNTYNENKKNVSISVLKIWDDSGYEYKRPASIEVSLLKDGNIVDTVTLSKNNAWGHSWSELSSNSVWTVVENVVPYEYSAIYTVKGTAFIITNKYTPELPRTGMLWWPVPMLAVAGLLLIFAGLKRRLGKAGHKYEK